MRVWSVECGVWSCLALLLAGCAGPRVTALDVEIARHQAEAARACWAAQAIPAFANARDAALIVMARALAGDPCRQTNVYDSRAAIAAAQNRAVGQAVPGVVSGAVALGGVVAGADVLKSAVRNTGGAIVGNGNTVYDTRSNISSRQGEGATLSAPASGPDMSAPVTHYHLPEAQP